MSSRVTPTPTGSNQVASGQSVLLISRQGGGLWKRSASQINQQLALSQNIAALADVSCTSELRVRNPLGVTVREFKRRLRMERPSTVVVLDPLSMGGVGPLGLFKAFRLGRLVKRFGSRAVVVAWDVADPQQSVITRFVARGNLDRVLALGSLPTAVDFMGLRLPASGPAPEVVLGPMEFHLLSTASPSLASRSFDVFVPACGDPDRDVYVAAFVRECVALGLKVFQPSTMELYEDYIDALRDCRAVFVVNGLRSGFLRFRHMRDFPSRTHLVGRNAEGIVAGCLLLTQGCPELSALVGAEARLTWSSAEDAAHALATALNDPAAMQAQVDAARGCLAERVRNQPTLQEIWPSHGPSDGPVSSERRTP